MPSKENFRELKENFGVVKEDFGGLDENFGGPEMKIMKNGPKMEQEKDGNRILGGLRRI